MSVRGDKRTVEWYRPALLGRMVLVWVVGVMMIGIGMVSSGIAFDPTGRFSSGLQTVCLLGGVSCTVSGALFGLLGMLRVLAVDPVWLLLRLDGVVFYSHGDEVFIPWQSLKGVRWVERCLILESEQVPDIRIRHRFMGISGPDLVARIIEVQRQALMGVLQQRMD